MRKEKGTEYEFKKINTKFLVVSENYQRRLDTKKVDKIVKNFDPGLVNVIKVSHRNGKYYVFDGQHTMEALKKRQGGKDIMVECKIFYGMTEVDEANYFAQQNGITKRVDTRDKFRALCFAGDEKALTITKIVESVGLQINLTNGSKGDNKIVAVGSLQKMYDKLGDKGFEDALSIIKNAWGGDKESLSNEILMGMTVLMKKCGDSLDEEKLIEKLSKVSPRVIIREAKVYKDGGDSRFAREMLNAYNKGLRESNKVEVRW